MRIKNMPPLKEFIWDAFDNLYKWKQRSALALLGIVIGTASVLAMLTTGHMAERETLRQFEQMGINTFVVNVTAGSSANLTSGNTTGAILGLNRQSVESLPNHIASVVALSPIKTGQAFASLGYKYHNIDLAAALPAIQNLLNLRIASGRFLSDVDEENMVVVLGANAAHTLADGRNNSLIGAPLRLGSYVFTIIGVLQYNQNNSFAPIDINKAAIVSFGSSKRAMGTLPINAAIGLMKRGANSEIVASAVTRELTQVTPAIHINIQSAGQLISALKMQRELQTHLLAAIGGISLIVGGIGVMNVMLMSVLERRREIGLRMSVGATPSDIKFAFLIEAAILSAIGGVFGCLVGTLIALLVAIKSGWEFDLPIVAFPLSVGMATIVGVVFGVYPALLAARLTPVEALRAE